MIQLSQTFTPYVGVSPGTTTLTFDVPRYNPGGELSTRPTIWNPYVNEIELNGRLGQVKTKVRWDILALTVALGFAGVLGASAYLKR